MSDRTRAAMIGTDIFGPRKPEKARRGHNPGAAPRTGNNDGPGEWRERIEKPYISVADEGPKR
jgi:hypothetical protein